MKTENKQNILVIILISVLLMVGVIFGLTDMSVEQAYAATGPLYTVPFSYTLYGGVYVSSATVEKQSESNVYQSSKMQCDESTYNYLTFQIYGTSYSGTAKYTGAEYIGSSTVNIKTNSGFATAAYTVKNSSGTVVATASTHNCTISSLSTGTYTVEYIGTSSWVEDGNIRDHPRALKLVATFQFKVDTTKPTISGASTSTTGKYTNSAFTVSVSDSDSGAGNLYYKTPGSSSYSSVSVSKTFPAGSINGLYTFYGLDKSGNQSAYYYVYYDNVKPTGAIKNASGTTLTTAYTNGAFSYTASDSGSGINKLQYMIPDTTLWAPYTSGTTIEATSTNGVYKFRAFDKALNISEISEITLDTTKPTGVLYSGTTAVSSGSKSTASYIKYVASDALSGIKTVYMKVPGSSSYVSYTNGTQMSINGTYYFYCVDNAGNVSDTVSISLDNTKPTLSISPGSFGDTLSDSFMVTATDNIGGVELYCKSPNGATIQSFVGHLGIGKTMPDGVYRFYAVDDYGNTSATYSVTLSIPAPVAQIVQANEGTKRCIIWTNSNCSGVLDGEDYVNGTWISTEGSHTFVLTNDAQRSSTYTFTIDHYYKVSSVVSPTCTADGYTVYVCDNCGDSYKANYVSALGHNYVVTKEVESSCTGEGYSVYTCTRCGDTYNDDVVSANGHDYGSWYTVKASTCLETGIKRRDCVSCGAYETGIIEAKGHNYVAAVTSPTCIEQGYTTHVCSRCADTYIDSYVDARGHNYVATVTEPTCTERGYTTQTCSACGDSYIENYTDAHGHTYGAWRISKNATCTESGLRYKTCMICGYRYNEAIPALGHDYEAEVIEPTCVDKGYTTHICSRCGVGYNDAFVDALGHDYQPIRVEPTCAEEGYIGQRCTRCGDTYNTEILKATGHNYVETYIEVTCTEEGCILHICLNCGFEYKTDVVSPSGHSLDTHVLLAATCEESGERYYGCTKCDYERIDEIPAKGHNYELAYEENVDGVIKRTYICSTCADSYTQEVGAEYEEVTNYVTYLLNEYSPYMIWVFLATAGVWSAAMGIAIIIATKNEEKVKARKMLVNYGIGLIVIFILLVAAPLLVKGIAGLIT